MQNIERNYRLCFRHFRKEKITTNGYMSGDPVYLKETTSQQRHISAKPRKTLSSAPLHVIFHGSQIALTSSNIQRATIQN